jgi:16S rRNA (guanine527-N7)-methyltransferase
MQERDVIKILQSDLNFNNYSINKIKLFVNRVIKANQRHNFISKSTENDIWHRHVLDSAQLVKFIDFTNGSLADLGTGAGFPGIVLAIFNDNKHFHVKLYEKSPVKRKFLSKVIEELNINATVLSNIYEDEISAEFIVSRAFKKLDYLIQVSREIVKKPHKLIVLKGQNAQEELIKALKNRKYLYKLEKSITDNNSKIVVINIDT